MTDREMWYRTCAQHKRLYTVPMRHDSFELDAEIGPILIEEDAAKWARNEAQAKQRLENRHKPT